MRFSCLLIADHDFCSASPDWVYFMAGDIEPCDCFEIELAVETIGDRLKLGAQLIASSIPQMEDLLS